MGYQPVEDGVAADELVHPAVLGGGGADTHILQQTDGVIVLAVRDGEGDGGLPKLRVGFATEDRFTNHDLYSPLGAPEKGR